jgi:hypothetical protein
MSRAKFKEKLPLGIALISRPKLIICVRNVAFRSKIPKTTFQEEVFVFLEKIPSPPKFNANTY